jgi:hypothetical protein
VVTVIYHSLIGRVVVIRILHSTRSGNSPDWRRYILLVTFKLDIEGSGWDLKKE